MKHYINDEVPFKNFEPSKETLEACGEIIWKLFQDTNDVSTTRHKFEDMCIEAVYDFDIAKFTLGGGPSQNDVLNRSGGQFMLLKEYINEGFFEKEFLLCAHNVACECCFALYEFKD